MKVALVGDDTGHNFTFTSPQPIAVNQREDFKRELTNLISRNRDTGPLMPPPAVPTPAATPRPNMPVASSSRAPSASPMAGDRQSTPGSDGAADYRLRKTVLVGNPELASLHRELVMSGQITEAEFWDSTLR